jgi:small subunit ribosomal protein S16
MPVRIRLRRIGRKKQPSYRIVVADSRSPRSGGYIENVGFYNPRRDPIELRIDLEKVEQWVSRGAELTPTVASLVRKARRGEGVPPGGAQAPAAEAKPAPKARAARAESPAAEAVPAEAAAEAPAGGEAAAEGAAE